MRLGSDKLTSKEKEILTKIRMKLGKSLIKARDALIIRQGINQCIPKSVYFTSTLIAICFIPFSVALSNCLTR